MLISTGITARLKWKWVCHLTEFFWNLFLVFGGFWNTNLGRDNGRTTNMGQWRRHRVRFGERSASIRRAFGERSASVWRAFGEIIKWNSADNWPNALLRRLIPHQTWREIQNMQISTGITKIVSWKTSLAISRKCLDFFFGFWWFLKHKPWTGQWEDD
jgi:hypothetical protein